MFQVDFTGYVIAKGVQLTVDSGMFEPGRFGIEHQSTANRITSYTRIRVYIPLFRA